MMKRKAESDMTVPVSQWLKGNGFQWWTEISPPFCCYTFVDMIGFSQEKDILIAVEMKKSLTSYVIYQAMHHDLFSDFIYVAVFTNPRQEGIEKCRKLGIGVLKVDNGVDVLLESSNKFGNFTNYRERMIERLLKSAPGGIAGLPVLKGEGPAQDCYDRVCVYKRDNPDAKWKDIFANVENHYSSYISMAGAMRKVEEKRLRNQKNVLS